MVNAGDDQGSGWFEVKKKHRSSSKLSIQNWVGGFSGKNVNRKGGSSQDKCSSQLSRAGREANDRIHGGVEHHSSASNANEKEAYCPDKGVVNDDNGHASAPVLTNSNCSSIDNEKISEKKTDAIHKIKWGDLEDNAFTFDLGRSAASGIKFGEIGDDDLAMCRKSGDTKDSILCSSIQEPHEVNKDVVEVGEAAGDSQRKRSLSPPRKSYEECEEMIEVSSSNVDTPATTSKTLDPSADVEVPDKTGEPMSIDFLTACEPSDDKVSCSFVEEAVTISGICAPILPSEVGEKKLPEARDGNGDAETAVTAQDLEASPSELSLPENSGSSNTVTPGEDHKDFHDNMLKDNVTDTQIRNAFGEAEEGESKERFRERLWCFLFENLNRAVDELYLLCELECDLEQVKEAILVLEESASDFKELNNRVQKFEKLKKNSSRSTSGAVMTMKSDHRRPHALSWEVRRMTTSPHRAEILSSSLEAFNKIQQEREKMRAAAGVNDRGPQRHSRKPVNIDDLNGSRIDVAPEFEAKSIRQAGVSDHARVDTGRQKRGTEPGRSGKVNLVPNSRISLQTPSASDPNASKLPPKGSSAIFPGGKNRKEQLTPSGDLDGNYHSVEQLKRRTTAGDKEKEKEKRNSISWKSMDAWKEKRNWENILASPCRVSSRVSHSPCMSRRSAERARILHDKLMSPEKKKKTALDLRKEAEEKHARAMRIRSELENERVQKLQRTSEKLNRVYEWQAVRSMKLREGMYARHQRSESRHEAYIAQVVKRAGDESVKVNEVRFITSLNEENKKFLLHQKLHVSEMRRAEKIQVRKSKQKEDTAREEAVMERRKLKEAAKLQRLAETQRRKEEAQVRREEERKASSAAREARALEQLRRKAERAKAQQEEAELLAQRLAERLSESEQRRKVYLEQIRERASMDFRDQSSPLMRRSLNKENQGRTTPTSSGEDNQETNSTGLGVSHPATNNVGVQQSMKRRIKKIRQRLMSLKHEHPDTSTAENSGIGYRTAMATARAKILRWLQDLQRLRQKRKEGAASIGLITAEMIKFLESKELELHASRQAGLLDFISSALPALHISKPEACQVTIYFLRILKVLLSLAANRSYLLAQNLLPPLIPMLSAALENYIKIAASLNGPGGSNLQTSKTTSDNFDSISEVLDGFLYTVKVIIGHATSDERHLQMQGGLLELVVAYQVIHRLRDLFALYDRPQAECSPFPSSILLSIKLLVVLTSKPYEVFSIDWEFLTQEALVESKAELANPTENAAFGCSFQGDSVEEHKPPSVPNGGLSALCGKPDYEPCGEACTVKSVNECEKEQVTNVELNCTNMSTGDVLLETSQNPTSGINRSSPSQKDEDFLAKNMQRKDEKLTELKQPHAFLLSALSETSLVSLPSLLTAVLLQANNRLSSEQSSFVLPSNFEEVATGVLKVLNNLALMDITFLQKMLARPDLKMEFFHVMGFLLTHCTSNWKVATDQVGFLLLESLSLLAYFSLFHPGNQAVLRWGNSPTILHKVCDLPFMFFSNPELMPVLAATLVAACYGSEQNKDVIKQELSTEMLLSLVNSCRNFLPVDNPSVEGPTDTNAISDPKRIQSDIPTRTACSSRSSCLSSSKSETSSKTGKSRISKDNRTKIAEDLTSTSLQKSNNSQAVCANMPLYSRFPANFIDRAEQFFAVELSGMDDEVHV